MKVSTKLSIGLCAAGALTVAFVWIIFRKRKFTKKVFGAYDEDDLTSFSVANVSDDDDQEEEVSNVQIGNVHNKGPTDDEGNQEDENHSATKNAEMVNESTVDVIHAVSEEVSDTDILSNTSESTDWSDFASSETSINADRNTQTQASVVTLDFNRLQASLDEQISSPVVQAHTYNRKPENSAPKSVKADEFPFLMGASTVCEYIDREYREVVYCNSPNTELK